MVELVSHLCNDEIVANEDNSQVFPLYSDVERLPSENSALARIHAKRVEYNERNEAISNLDWWDEEISKGIYLLKIQ